MTVKDSALSTPQPAHSSLFPAYREDLGHQRIQINLLMLHVCAVVLGAQVISGLEPQVNMVRNCHTLFCVAGNFLQVATNLDTHQVRVLKAADVCSSVGNVGELHGAL